MNCPHCQRVLYSRQQKTCGYCGGVLPEGVRFDDWRIDEIKDEFAASAKRYAETKQREEEERKEEARRRNDGGGAISF